MKLAINHLQRISQGFLTSNHRKRNVWIGILGGIVLFGFCFSAGSQENSLPYLDETKKISMEFKEANLDDVLRIFSHQTGLNFIASSNIREKTITLFLDNVPVDEALERILYANNLTYEQNPRNGIFVVKELVRSEDNLITRVYHLRYATTSNAKLTSTLEMSNSGAGGNSGIALALQNVLSGSGKIVEDPRTNSLIISDIPPQFPVIEQTLAKLDVPVPQIIIEVEMLDVSKSTADKIGVKYGDSPLTFKGGERDVVYPWDQNRLLNKGYSFEDAEYRVGTISAAGLTATLQFLRTQSDTKNLARPRILTLNNETAEIKIATSEAIGVKNQTNSAQGSATTSIEAERVETGVFLTVTPQANLLTGEITMAVSPKVIQARAGGTFEGKTFKDPEERGSQSILKVYSGDTIMLGGLLRTDYTNTTTKFPILGDIPLIGGAFRHKDDSKSERELVIFITPHIVAENSIPKSLSKISKKRNSGHKSFSKKVAQKNNSNQKVIPENASAIRQQEIDKSLSTIEDRRF